MNTLALFLQMSDEDLADLKKQFEPHCNNEMKWLKKAMSPIPRKLPKSLCQSSSITCVRHVAKRDDGVVIVTMTRVFVLFKDIPVKGWAKNYEFIVGQMGNSNKFKMSFIDAKKKLKLVLPATKRETYDLYFIMFQRSIS